MVNELVIAYFLPIIFLIVFLDVPGRRVLLFLFWGFLVAIPAALLEPSLATLFPEVLYPEITLSPVIEEFLKALPVMLLAFTGIHSRDKQILSMAMASGIGFAIIENISVLSPLGTSFAGIAARSFSTALMHGCTTALIGYGVFLLRDVNRQALFSLLFGFFTLAVTIHAFFNLFVTSGIPSFELIGFIFPFPLFLFLLVLYQIDIRTIISPPQPAS